MYLGGVFPSKSNLEPINDLGFNGTIPLLLGILFPLKLKGEPMFNNFNNKLMIINMINFK